MVDRLISMTTSHSIDLLHSSLRGSYFESPCLSMFILFIYNCLPPIRSDRSFIKVFHFLYYLYSFVNHRKSNLLFRLVPFPFQSTWICIRVQKTSTHPTATTISISLTYEGLIGCFISFSLTVV